MGAEDDENNTCGKGETAYSKKNMYCSIGLERRGRSCLGGVGGGSLGPHERHGRDGERKTQYVDNDNVRGKNGPALKANIRDWTICGVKNPAGASWSRKGVTLTKTKIRLCAVCEMPKPWNNPFGGLT